MTYNTVWGTSHSATGAIESALKYVSLDAHWIARRLATAGGKRIKTRPLSTAATIRTSTEPVSISNDKSLLHLRGNNTATRPAVAGRQEARLLAEPARALPAGANLRNVSSLQPRFRSPASNARIQSAAAIYNTQPQLRYDSSTRRHRASTLPSRITPPPIGSAALQPATSAFRLASHHALQVHRGSSKPALFRGHHTCSGNNMIGFQSGDTVVKHKTHTVRTQ
jgi:hypothetical protein